MWALGCPHPGALPGQEGLEGYPYWEVGAASTDSLQDTCLAQLLCHVSHIKKAWKLWPWDRAMTAGVKGLKLWGNQDRKQAGRRRAEKGRAGVGGLLGQELGQLTLPGLGLRHWMK